MLQHWGFLFLFDGGLDHRLVAYFLSLSNHLQMRWLITPAMTAIIRDISISIANTPFLSPDPGRQHKNYIILLLPILHIFSKGFSHISETDKHNDYNFVKKKYRQEKILDSELQKSIVNMLVPKESENSLLQICGKL